MTAAARPAWLDEVAERAAVTPPSWWSRHLPPAGGAGRRAGVLLLVGPVEGDPARQDVVLTERAHDMRSHAGQVAFPGGSLDPGEDAVAAALREAEEEVGLDPTSVDVVTVLPELYMSHRDFGITPVVAWWHRPHPLRVVEPREVASIVRAPLDELADADARFTVTHPSGYRGPGFDADGLLVWGFTAGVLSRFLSLAGLERPWDTGRTEPLPPHLIG